MGAQGFPCFRSCSAPAAGRVPKVVTKASRVVSKVAGAVAAPNSNRPLSSCAPGRVPFATAGYLTLAWVAQD